MGCDIHLVIEKLHKEERVDVYATDIQHEGKSKAEIRCYEFFYRLAGVREELAEERGWENVSKLQAKGLPRDMSSLTKMCINNMHGDDHTHSFLSMQKFIDIFKEFDEQAYKDFEGYVKIFNKKIPDVKVLFDGIIKWYDDFDIDDYRIVFYFDN